MTINQRQITMDMQIKYVMNNLHKAPELFIAMTKGAFMPYRNNRNYDISTCKKLSRARRTRNYNLWTEFS